MEDSVKSQKSEQCKKPKQGETCKKPFAHMCPFTSRSMTMADECTVNNSTENMEDESGIMHFPHGSTAIDARKFTLQRCRLGIFKATIMINARRRGQERLGPHQMAQIQQPSRPATWPRNNEEEAESNDSTNAGPTNPIERSREHNDELDA